MFKSPELVLDDLLFEPDPESLDPKLLGRFTKTTSKFKLSVTRIEKDGT